MRLLVTGGSGFIGSHIVRAAVERGWSVCCYDKDWPTWDRGALAGRCPIWRKDIRDRSAVNDAFDTFKPDAVCHHAAHVSVPDSFTDPYHDADVNIMGGLSLLEACERHNVKRFVFASSGGAIYGDVPAPLLANELTLPNPSSPYGVNKLAFERLLQIHAERTGMRATILRYSNVYGPGQKVGVVPTFLAAARSGQPLRVMGNCVRDYVHVSDVVKANMLALDDELPGDVLNVSTGIGTTTSQLAHLIGSFTLSEGRWGDVFRSVIGSVFPRKGMKTLRDGITDLTLRG